VNAEATLVGEMIFFDRKTTNTFVHTPRDLNCTFHWADRGSIDLKRNGGCRWEGSSRWCGDGEKEQEQEQEHLERDLEYMCYVRRPDVSSRLSSLSIMHGHGKGASGDERQTLTWKYHFSFLVVYEKYECS
jgi:hypothetical protein